MQLSTHRTFGSKRNMNAQKACQMALKGESFPEEGFKFMWGTCYGTTTYLGHALSALLFHFSLLLNTSMFVTIVKVFLLGPKAARKGRLRRPLLL
jgi:hypothetical protein